MFHHLHTHLAIFAFDAYVFSTNIDKRYAILAITKHFKIPSTWLAKWRIARKVNKIESILFSRLRQTSRDACKIEPNYTDSL